MRAAIPLLMLALCLGQRAVSATEVKIEGDPREHWAFQTPVKVALPAGKQGMNPIDALLSMDHEKHGVKPVGEARKEYQVRRLYLDLIGLPLTREELQAFLADNAEGAYERCVERLLNSAQYGERWARHWMDVWRYSDWFGRRQVPDVWNSAPQIWRWRDWIVRSLNADKGYDRMIQEMLAGDEIAPDDPHTVVATGYLVRNWYALNPNQWMRDNVEHTGKAFLGLTFNCAHCHDHKYDPISREDYFGFRAFFEPLYLRQDRWPGEKDPGKFQDYKMSVLRKPLRDGMISVFDKDADAKTWLYAGGDERNRETERAPATPHMPAILGGDTIRAVPVSLTKEKTFPGLKPEYRSHDLAAAMEAVKAAKERWEQAMTALKEVMTSATANPVAGQEQAANELKAMEVVKAEATRLRAALQESVAMQTRMAADDVKFGGKTGDLNTLSKAAWEEERLAAVAKAKVGVMETEQSVAGATTKVEAAAAGAGNEEATAAQKKMIAQRDAAKKVLATAEAELKKPPGEYTPMSPEYPKESTGRRKALAEWMTGAKNPLTARVAVNHIWSHHFHVPLVTSVYDFGRNGAKPTHPELLDWLAVEFMESGWSMKHLHRLIVTSDAYRRSSAAGADAVAAAKSDPENKLLWRMNESRMEAEVVRDSILHLAGSLDPKMGGQELENSEMPGSTRRSLYFACYPEAGGQGEFTTVFDAPDATECYRRSCTVMPQQALALTNSKLVHDQSTPLAKRITTGIEAKDGVAFVKAAFETLLSRAPEEQEKRECLAFLAQQQAVVGGDAAARESLVRVLLNHNDFLTIR